MFGLSVAFLIFITALMIYFVIRYSQKRHPEAEQIEGHLGLEIVWTVVPLVLFLVDLLLRLDQLRVHAPGAPGRHGREGHRPPVGLVLRIPQRQADQGALRALDKPMKMEVRSADVVHGFFIPSFRLKIDAVPGPHNTTWFQATKLGSYDIECTVICGVDHSLMLRKVVVVPEDEFKAWYFGGEDAPEPGQGLRAAEAHPDLKDLPPGLAVLRPRAASPAIPWTASPWSAPPSRASSARSRRSSSPGPPATVTVDDAYLRRAITNPMAQVVSGYPPAMPPTPLTDQELDEVVRYIKTLK